MEFQLISGLVLTTFSYYWTKTRASCSATDDDKPHEHGRWLFILIAWLARRRRPSVPFLLVDEPGSRTPGLVPKLLRPRRSLNSDPSSAGSGPEAPFARGLTTGGAEEQGGMETSADRVDDGKIGSEDFLFTALTVLVVLVTCRVINSAHC